MKEGEPAIQIRRATVDDAPSIAEVLHESFVEYRALYTTEAFAATTSSSTQILQRMSEGPVWVAVQENMIVGTVSAVLKNRSVYVRGMAILPTTRGQHLGQRLLEQVDAFAMSCHAQSLYLSTTPFLMRAIRLYERCGFQRTDEGPHDLFQTPLFTMVKPLESRSMN